MKKIQDIFAKYCRNQYLIDNYEYFIDVEINENNEVTSLTIFDSDYHGDFPFVNKIGEFIGEFKKLKNLEIELYGQIIPTFEPLIDLHQLETISVEANTQIESLDFAKNMNNLQSINIENTDIQSIEPLKNKKKLRSISLPNAQIEDISPIRDLPELTAIDFDNNQIKEIDGLRFCRKLKYISLRNNGLTSIDALQNLYELESLLLSDNRINNLNSLRFLTKITHLELQNNQISAVSILGNFSLLRTLQIQNNQVLDISSLKNCTHLSYLDIAENQIQNIEILEGKSLRVLNISKNPIQSVEVLSSLNALYNLLAVDVKFKIDEDFQFEASLTNLVLSNCGLSNIDFLQHQKELIRLNLSNNEIISIEGLEKLEVLQNLNLRNNKITKPIPYEFPKLKAIDLRENEFGNQLFGNFANFHKGASAHYTHIFQDIETYDIASIEDLRQIIADDLLAKGEKEAALAAYYFDEKGHHTVIYKELLDIRLYLLKCLSNRNSPFVFNLQQKLLRTVESQFVHSDSEKQLIAAYLDKIKNIENRTIDKPSIQQSAFFYFFCDRPLSHRPAFDETMKTLLAEEEKLLTNVIIKPKRKRYERKTSANDSNEFAGCIVWLILMVILGILMFAGLVPTEVLRILVFVMAIIKVIVHFAGKQ